MISVKVTYTVKPSFVAGNRENIDQFIKDFKNMGSNDFRYTVYLLKDGKTFVHHSIYKDEQIQKVLLDTASFKSFQQKRDESGLEGEPKIEVLQMIASSHELL